MHKPKLDAVEWLLIGAACSLMLQFFPSFSSWLWAILDARSWSLTTWLVLQAIGLMVLLAVKFAPSLAEHRLSFNDSRREKANKVERDKEIRQIQERRKLIQGIKEGRRRRI